MVKNKILIVLAVALIVCSCLALTVSADYYDLNDNNPNRQSNGSDSYYYYAVDDNENVLFQCFLYVADGGNEGGFYYRFSKYVAEYLVDEYIALFDEVPISIQGLDWQSLITYFSNGTIQGPITYFANGEYDPNNTISAGTLYDFYTSHAYDSYSFFIQGLSDLMESYNDIYKIQGYQSLNNQLTEQYDDVVEENLTLMERIAELNVQVIDAYYQGKQDGLDEGFTNGMNEANALENGIVTIMNAPFYILKGVFNFEIFGINILTIILSIISLLIVGFFVKLII